jgi:EAL domain-containing protein (putative c-di-GMP-specific phosphodiesterase class I)
MLVSNLFRYCTRTFAEWSDCLRAARDARGLMISSRSYRNLFTTVAVTRIASEPSTFPASSNWIMASSPDVTPLSLARKVSAIRFYEPEMNAHVDRRIAIERELRAAILAKVIVPYYQPLVAFEGERIVGFEALARWKSDKLGWVGPDVFITVAEEIGLIGQLGDQLLRQACLDARTWPPELTLAFNISAVQLRDATLGLRILAILAETGFSPRWLELEITETALVDHIAVAQNIIQQLRQAGVRIALDDFGTGYATLSQLLSLHLDRIKIDRSFVDRLGKDNEGTTIVRAILGLANGFGLATTAEGIEDADQLASLKANGCNEGQGYLFGKAVPASEVAGILAKTPRSEVTHGMLSADAAMLLAGARGRRMGLGGHQGWRIQLVI